MRKGGGCLGAGGGGSFVTSSTVDSMKSIDSFVFRYAVVQVSVQNGPRKVTCFIVSGMPQFYTPDTQFSGIYRNPYQGYFQKTYKYGS